MHAFQISAAPAIATAGKNGEPHRSDSDGSLQETGHQQGKGRFGSRERMNQIKKKHYCLKKKIEQHVSSDEM
jgi:hypothetical protein